jgi:hypothetical protein
MRGERTSRAAPSVAWLLALVALLAGCGSQSQTPSGHVAAYLRQVNRIEGQLKQPLAIVTAASARVAATAGAGSVRAGRRQAAVLMAAERRIATLNTRVAALPAPAPAAHLRTLLVSLGSREAQLTVQTARLESFLPAYGRDLRPLAPATLQLERALAVNQAFGAAAVQEVYGRKAAALRAFGAVVEAVLGRLHRLRPPIVSLSGYRAQVRSLVGMHDASGALATALGAGRTTGLSTLLARFDRAAAATGTQAAHQAQVAAVRRYDSQVNDVSVLTAQAEQERLRLSSSLS